MFSSCTVTVKHILPIVVSALILAACGSAPPVPVDRFYRLDTATGNGKLLFNNVTVKRFKSDSLHNDRPILYGNSKQEHLLKQYHYHHWSDAPSRMLQQQLIAFLQHNGIAGTVVAHEPGMKPDNIIYGKIVRFEQIFNGSRSHAEVGITLGVQKSDKQMPAFVRAYKQQVPAASNNMQDVAAAFSTAVNRIFTDFIADVSAHKPLALK